MQLNTSKIELFYIFKDKAEGHGAFKSYHHSIAFHCSLDRLQSLHHFEQKVKISFEKISWKVPWWWPYWNPSFVHWLGTVTSPGVLHTAHTLLFRPECLIVFFISCICLPLKAFETVRRSICESNVQKEKVAAAAASVESRHSLCLSASLWGRDYTLNPGMSRQKDEKDYFSLADTAEKKRMRGAFLTTTHRV